MPSGLYCPVFVSVLEHRKTVRLAALLRADRFLVLGHLVALWLWGMANADERGLIREATAEELALAAHWSGRAEDWESALLLSGYVDREAGGYVLHDWSETGGKVLREQRLERERWLARKGQRPTGRASRRPPTRGGRPEVYSAGASTGAPGGAPAEPRVETRRDSKDSPVGSTDPRAHSYPVWFETWWKVYTHHSGRGRNKAGTLALAEKLPAGERDALARLTAEHAARRAAAALAGQFVPAWPDPERYIKRRGWEDEYVLAADAPAAAPADDDTARLIREEAAHAADPLWPEYERLVVARRIPVDWDAWRQARAEAS